LNDPAEFGPSLSINHVNKFDLLQRAPAAAEHALSNVAPLQGLEVAQLTSCDGLIHEYRIAA